MGRAMKTFYNPVQRASRSQLDALSSSHSDHKPHSRIPGPYLASTPWRRHSRRRTSDGINEDRAAHHDRTDLASMSQRFEADPTTEVSSTNLDIPKKYNEQPFDLDADCGDVFEEYFLTPSQASQQRLDRLAAGQTTTQATQSMSETGDQVFQQRLAVAELAYARHRLHTASQALSDEDSAAGRLPRPPPFPSAVMMVSSASRPRNTSHEHELISLPTIHSLDAPRLTHRQAPTTQETTETRLSNIPASFRPISGQSEPHSTPSLAAQYRLIPVEGRSTGGTDRMPRDLEQRYSHASIALGDDAFAVFSSLTGEDAPEETILFNGLNDWNIQFDF
ncbi:hypothetical protein DFH28DRAFT_967744 [Melampsora americana]|nr:hypothetical protein DFH28DRAFT_967744 [Melampsora americana]